MASGKGEMKTETAEKDKEREEEEESPAEAERLFLDAMAREEMKKKAMAAERSLSETVVVTATDEETSSASDSPPASPASTSNGTSSLTSEVTSASVEPQAGAWKWSIRKRIWDFLESRNLAQNPRPVHHRIPNFVGAEEAAGKLAELPEFLTANFVKVNPDTPQKQVRFLVLSAGKQMIVPQPRLRTGFFSLLNPLELSQETILEACSPRGSANHSRPIGLFDKIKVDLIVVGSVAVDPKTGARLGKGEGFAELEYGMLRWMGAINDSTPIVTTVRDEQLVDDIPTEKMLIHDVPVDIICTPTQVIRIQNSPIPKPQGIYWDKLSPEKLSQVKVLRELKAHIEKEKGIELPTGVSENLPPRAQMGNRGSQKQISIELLEGKQRDPKGQRERRKGSGKGESVKSGKEGEKQEVSKENVVGDPRLLIRNVSKDTKWTDLQALIEKKTDAPIGKVKIFMREGQSSGMAIASLEKGVDVDTLIKNLEGLESDGRLLRVEVSTSPKVPKKSNQRTERVKAIDFPSRVFIRNIQQSTTKKEILEVFEKAGIVPLKMDFLKFEGKFRGLARVALPPGTDINTVIRVTNGTAVNSRKIIVQEDNPGPKVNFREGKKGSEVKGKGEEKGEVKVEGKVVGEIMGDAVGKIDEESEQQ